MKTRRQKMLSMSLVPTLSQISTICKQEIAPHRQMPINAIVIEGYGMCPNCRQQVSPITENAYWYRKKWLQFANSVAKKNGREYRAGYGFRTPTTSG